MSKKFVYMVALLLLMLFVCNSCIIVPVRSYSSDNHNSVKEPKRDIIKGKFQVKASKSTVELKDNSGRIYVLQDLSKSQRAHLQKMNGKWIGAEIEVLSKSKAKKQKARLIDIL